MKQYCVVFQNNYGKMGILVRAIDEPQAIQKAIGKDFIKDYHSIEVIHIVKE